MNCNLFRSVVFSAVLSPFAVCVAAAGEWHWSGLGGDSLWTNPENWQERSSYPGAVEGNSDAAIFGAVTSDAATEISVDGVAGIREIRFVGANAPAYTFKAETSGNVLFLERGASISMAADVVNSQTFSCPMDFGLGSWPNVWFTNDSTVAEMVFSGYALNKERHAAAGSDYMPILCFSGKGGYRLLGGGNEYYVNGIIFMNEGAIHVDAPESSGATFTRWKPKNWGAERTGSDAFTRIVIPAGSNGFGLGDGGGGGRKQLFKALVNTVIEGAGSLPHVARIDGSGYPYMFMVSSNRTLKIDVPIGGSGSDGSRFSRAAGFSHPIGTMGGGVIELASSNTYSGATMLAGWEAASGRITVKAAKFGAKGCAPTESNLGIGTWIAFVGTGGTLVNTGVGETCDRDFVLMPHVAMTNGTCAPASAVGTVRNGGTGELVLTGDVSSEGDGNAFELDGGTWGISFAGTASGEKDITLGLSGAVTLNALPARFSAVRLSGGNVSLGDSVLSLPPVTVASGRSVINVADGKTLTVASLSKTSGVSGTLDIRLGVGARVKVTDISVACPPSITVDGKAAAYDAEGYLVPTAVSWSAAVNGSWSESGKWSPTGVPAAGTAVSVSASGASYEVKVSAEDEVSPSSIEVSNGTAGETATVRFEGAASFADMFVNVGAGGRIVAEKGADFRHSSTGAGQYSSEEGGTLKVESGSLKLPSASGDFILNGGTVEVVGKGTMLDIPTNCTLGAGIWRILDNASMTSPASYDQYLSICPDGPGETARMHITAMDDTNSAVRTIAPLLLYSRHPGAKAVLDCVTDEDAADDSRHYFVYPNIPTIFSVGYLSGYAELNVSNGFLQTQNSGMSVGTGRHFDGDREKPLLAAPYAVTGVVNMAAGTLKLTGYAFCYNLALCSGLILGDAQQHESDDRNFNRYCGMLNMKGGRLFGNAGYLLLGLGLGAEGHLVQTGGDIEWDCGTEGCRTRVGVGVFGGEGSWVVSNGTATVRNRFFVGGATTNEFERPERGMKFFTEPQLSFSSGAVGKMVIAGGTTRLESGLFVGSDGIGTVELAPAWQDDAGNIVTGSLTVSDMVLSNRTASTLRFVLSDRGTAMLTVEGALAFASGVELEVDATRLNGRSSRGWRKLMSVGSFEGDVPAPEFIVSDASQDMYGKGFYLFERNGEKGLWVHGRLRGLVISVR